MKVFLRELATGNIARPRSAVTMRDEAGHDGACPFPAAKQEMLP